MNFDPKIQQLYIVLLHTPHQTLNEVNLLPFGKAATRCIRACARDEDDLLKFKESIRIEELKGFKWL